MAHIGKNYKLLARRDICIGCLDHRLALPEAWTIAAQVNKFPFGSGNQIITPKLSTLITDQWSSTPSWESVEFLLFGKPARFRFVWNGYDMALQRTKFRLHVWAGNSKGSNIPNFDFPSRCNQYFVGTSFGGQTMEGLENSWWGVTEVRWTADIAAATWSNYPP